MQRVAPDRCARVLAGRRLSKRLPARTRAHRWLYLILKHHQSRDKERIHLQSRQRRLILPLIANRRCRD